MNNHSIKRQQIFFILFFFSTLFYFMIIFLYSWETPKWFSRFPNAAGFRFILASGIFFLSTIAFFSTKLILYMRSREDDYWKIFIPAFLPDLIFSFLILSNKPLQTLHIYTRISDIAVWVMILFFLARSKEDLTVRFTNKIFFVWLFCAAAQITAEASAFAWRIPAYTSIAARFFIFAICSLYTGITDSPQNPETIDEVTARFCLSSREKDVFVLLVEGKTNNEIADMLCISLSTVKTHISRIFEKTGTKSRLEAALICKKR